MWSVAVEKSPITAPLTGAADAPDAAASPMPAAAILNALASASQTLDEVIDAHQRSRHRGRRYGRLPIGDMTARGRMKAPDAVAEVEATRPQAEATAPAEAPALPEIEHAIGETRRRVLDHMLDSEGDQTVAQIIAGLGNVSRNTAETAIRREYEAGRLLRVAPGVYRLAPSKPPEPPKPTPPPEPEPVRSDGHTNEEWFAALEAYLVDPSSWDVEKFGPPPDARDHRIPWDIEMRFTDRLRKREERRRDAEAAAARQAAADAELRAKLLAACNGNFTPGPGLEDLAPIKAVLELVPLDRVLSAIRWKVDKICYPKNPTLTSWRDRQLLKAIGEYFCEAILIPSMVDAWAAAGTVPQKAADASEALPRPSMRDGGLTRPRATPV